MRLLEMYDSVQGEGPNVGLPTTFVRFAGCNMRCPGWPCDSPYAIDPKIWRKESVDKTPHDLMWMLNSHYPKHVCITGGEPLLQKTEELNDFFGLLKNRGYTVDVFTNGSRYFPNYNVLMPNTTIVMDWKLAGSGEGTSFLDARLKNIVFLSDRDAVKFVVTDDKDLHSMKRYVRDWRMRPFQKYVAPAWGLIDPAYVIKFLEQYELFDVKLNLQVHKYIWPAELRGI